MNAISGFRHAYSLFRTDSRRDTYIAVVVALVVAVPLLLFARRHYSRIQGPDE